MLKKTYLLLAVSLNVVYSQYTGSIEGDELTRKQEPETFLNKDHHSRHHPMVQASANLVSLDVVENNEYYGTIYVGSKFEQNKVVFDTMSSQTLVLDSDVNSIFGMYDYEQSETGAEKPTKDIQDYENQKIRTNLGSVNFVAERYTDQMCLVQSREQRQLSSGKLCVNKSYQFGLVKQMIGEFSAGAVVGLAPSGSKTSYVNALWDQGVIGSRIVGLNFENPLDNKLTSKISFGHIDLNEIDKGQNGLRYYTNYATDNSGWGIIMDNVKYQGVNMTTVGTQHAKISFIDSANISIQVPDSVFQNFLIEFRKEEKSIGQHTLADGRTILMANKPCDQLYDVLGNIEFRLQGTNVVMRPRGYLYQIEYDIKNCFIGLQSIDDNANQFRLGTIFLQNFYTALDYDNNMILLGVNKGSSDKAKAYIDGDLPDPFLAGNSSLAIVIVILLILIAIGIIFYFRSAKSKASALIGGRSKSVSTGLNTRVNDDTLDEGLVTESLDDDNNDNIRDKE